MIVSTGISSRKGTRRLQNLVSVGPATLRHFELLGITSVAQLSKAEARQMYRRLCELTGERLDICCLDVFEAAVAQARNPRLPAKQCLWWYWSEERKARRG